MALSIVGSALAVLVNSQVLPPDPPFADIIGSLKEVPVPAPEGLDEYIADMDAALALGKALFWDMQVGSDGVTACASCHFHAGVDSRSKNTLSPGRPADDPVFQLGGPNYTLQPLDFPFRQLADRNDRFSEVLHDYNVFVGSQGIFASDFQKIRRAHAYDTGDYRYDSIFNVGGVNTRQVGGRNAPSVINAVFNYSNFLDGRASFYFNGSSPHGALDANAGIFVRDGNVLAKQIMRLPFSSLASQAVAPPLTDVEMSMTGRTWPDVGRKLLLLQPLSKQIVHPDDSVLGSYAHSTRHKGQVAGRNGLRTTYAALVRKAFHKKYWAAPGRIIIEDGVARVANAGDKGGAGYSQIEANFSFFFGLSLQLYQSTLVSDDAPIDRFYEGNIGALTEQQQMGLTIFVNQGRCAGCHSGPEFTRAAVAFVDMQRIDPRGFAVGTVSFMAMPTGANLAFYDTGFYNIGVRLTADDFGRGGDSPFINPITMQPYPLSFSRLGLLKRQGLLPENVARFVPDLPDPLDVDRTAVDGSFKTPSLRNIDLTGPYMHNGGFSTLLQVVDFYNRGGSFREQNIESAHPAIGNLNLTEEQKLALVDFMLALTDERVRQEMAPFDHPQLFIPNGLIGDHLAVSSDDTFQRNGFRLNEEVIEIPPVGAAGRPAENLPPLKPFLDLDQKSR